MTKPIDTNDVRQTIADRKGLIRHREITMSLCDEIDRLRQLEGANEDEDINVGGYVYKLPLQERFI